MKRIKKALRFGEYQFIACLILSLMNLFAVSQNQNAPAWLWIIAGSLYFIIAFIANLIDPC